MRSRTGNSLSTLMFLVPLFGVPLMAIFGVPQFVPVIASSVSEDAARPPGPRPKQRVGESVSATSFIADSSAHDAGQRTESQVPDLFRPKERPRRDSRPIQENASRGRDSKIIETSLSSENWLTTASSTEPVIDTNAKLADLFGTAASAENSADNLTETRSRARPAMARPQGEAVSTGSNTERFVSGSEQSTEGLTWRDAVRRLNELGIQEFRLEPGSRPGEFYFACEFTPHRDARVTRRFEAEAAEPLLAVQAVLRQINDWLTRR